MQGVIVLNKPSGITSNGAMTRLKQLLGVSKMGFLGTLDPLASGVLPVFVGKATKLIPIFEGLDKEYRVSLKLGERTDTFDAQGGVIERRELDGLTPGQVRKAVLGFAGEQEQETPEFSAAKFNGTPAYRLARSGRPVPARKRLVRLGGFEIESLALPLLTFRVSCSAGTYMRRLAEDIGRITGVGAHVTALERLHCGGLFTLQNSISLEQIENAVASGNLDFLRNPSEFMPDYMPVTIEKVSEDKLKNGQPISLRCDTASLSPPLKVKVLCSGGSLLAIGEALQLGGDELIIQPRKVLI
ncbi:MAG: tRNA pseudouridine(55) synthase TruB [SAR324 cluster bacterium]|nr:tRNA pseudouridine(55) synthase TruB [SAR324 cluster bacterium]